MQHVKISSKQLQNKNYLKVQCPFNKKFVAVAGASLGGVFDRDDRCWYLPPAREPQVRSLCLECFGNDGKAFLPAVIVHVRLDEGCPFLSPGVALLEGRILAKRRKETDTTCFLGEGVRVLSGGFSAKGRGSRGPVLRPKLNTLLEVTDVPLHVANRTNRNWPKWLTIAELMEQDSIVGVVDVTKLLEDTRQRELAMCLTDASLKEELERRKGIEAKRESPASLRARRRMLGRIKTSDEKRASEEFSDDIVMAMNEGAQKAAHEDELSGLMEMVTAAPVTLKPTGFKPKPKPTYAPGKPELAPWDPLYSGEPPNSDFVDADGAIVISESNKSKPKKLNISDEFMTQDELAAKQNKSQEGMGLGNKIKKKPDVTVKSLDHLLLSPKDLLKAGYQPGDVMAMALVAPTNSKLSNGLKAGHVTKTNLCLLQQLLQKQNYPLSKPAAPKPPKDDLDLDDFDFDDED